MRKILFVLVAVAMLLSACGGAQPTATPTAAPTAAPTTAPAAVPTVAPTATPLPPGSIQINGAGATFPLPVYTEWAYAYQYVDPSVVINYQGIGSGGGKKAIIDGTVDFAGSDSVLKDEEYQAGKDLQMYPILAGAVVVIYNVNWAQAFPADAKIPTLVLDRQTLVDIYSAKITKWNDPAILALNPDLQGYLPDASITVVHRSDGSGTTEIFTKALSAFSPEWKTDVGAGASVQWPVDKAGNGVGGKGNQGVAAAVQNTPNSLGYVELSYAVSNKLAYAAMRNKAGKVVQADAASVQSAMADFAGAFDAKLTANIVDAPGEGSWPIVGYTYLILHTTSMEDCLKARKLLEYIRWSLTDQGAGKRAAELGYAVLPPAVRDNVLAKLGEVTCKGQPVLK
ncbi:MAG: phosphate ABC transporter substrate-binding protein PstS [Anaerolineales bacterium]